MLKISKSSTSKKQFSREEAKKVGDQLDIDWKEIALDEFEAGINVELEHGTIDPHTNVTNDDPILTGKIALAHLNECKSYYSRLSDLEINCKNFKNQSSKKPSIGGRVPPELG